MLKPSDFIGKMILVGITIERSDKTYRQIQTHGTVVRFTNEHLFLKRNDGSEFCLGFSIEAFAIAKPGVYTERETGTEIVDPDYICQWKIISDENDAPDTLLKNGFSGFIKSSG